MFFREPDDLDLLGTDTATYAQVMRARERGPVVLFAPTFRDQVGNPFTQSALDLVELARFLKKMDGYLVIKGHRLVRENIVAENLPNVIACPSATDIYPVMPMVDLLLTDYSSIYMDYLLLDRPVAFFCSDYDQYVQRNRDLQFPYEQMTPGPRCTTQEELHEALQGLLQGKDRWQVARHALRNRAFSHHDGEAAHRIARHLTENNPR
jgi:CDP-glycerol glycerophosphotransferase